MQHIKVKIVFLGEKQYIFLKKVFSFIASFVGGHGIIFFQKKKDIHLYDNKNIPYKCPQQL